MGIDIEILKKYFSGTCTPEEKHQVIQYLSSGDNDLPLLDELLEQETQTVAPKELPPVMLKSLIYGIRKNTYPEFSKIVRPISRIWRYAMGTAAILLLVFIGVWVAQKKAGTPSANLATTERWDTLTNNSDATRKAILPDGSSIWLAARSSLSYIPARFGVAYRTIRLEGEAFFDVKTDHLHPFIVQHGAISTRVLGTAFNIEAYGNESDIRISLVRGKVAINAAHDTAMVQPMRYLKAGEQLVYRKQNGGITVKPLLYKEESMWKRGWMVLEAVPLTAALQRLERQYGLHIVVPGDIAASGKTVTAVFKGGTQMEILHNILFACRLQYVMKNNIIYVGKKTE